MYKKHVFVEKHAGENNRISCVKIYNFFTVNKNYNLTRSKWFCCFLLFSMTWFRERRYSTREQLLDDGMVSELGISHTYRHDTGVLSCFASNAYGQDEMTIQLIVQGRTRGGGIHFFLTVKQKYKSNGYSNVVIYFHCDHNILKIM
jgi:hypothetical protein